MSVKRYAADKDTTITNAFKSDLRTRGTGSNMGESDVLEVFSIYAQASSASLEAARMLIQFPIQTISDDRTAGDIPASGSVNFYLKLFNAAHGETLPKQFTLSILPVSQSWEEGTGLDMEEYTDLTRDGEGANWINAASGTQWTTEGGDYHTGSYVAGSSLPRFTQFFETGVEDLEVDITPFVEEIIAGTETNYGFGIQLTSSQESATRSYFTKRFFARGSEFFFKRPHIEARWDNSVKDNRGNFEVSSALKPAANNLQTLYLYNRIRGVYTDIPNIGASDPIFVNFFTSASAGIQINTTPVTGGRSSTGIYTASFALDTTASTVYDRWFSGSVTYFTGSFTPLTHEASETELMSLDFKTNISNLKSSYGDEEQPRLRLFARQKNLTPTLFTIASAAPSGNIIEDAYYKCFRLVDNCDIVPYGTGSTNHTRLSYDKNGNYFDFDMSILESGYAYAFKFVYLLNGQFEEQPEVFKFRVEEQSR